MGTVRLVVPEMAPRSTYDVFVDDEMVGYVHRCGCGEWDVYQRDSQTGSCPWTWWANTRREAVAWLVARAARERG